MTKLDKQLQDIATQNWDQFVAIIGPDAITTAKICLLRQQGKSYGEISVKLNVSVDTARYRCGECEVK